MSSSDPTGFCELTGERTRCIFLYFEIASCAYLLFVNENNKLKPERVTICIKYKHTPNTICRKKSVVDGNTGKTREKQRRDRHVESSRFRCRLYRVCARK